MQFFKKKIKSDYDQRIIDAINIRNVRNMFTFSLVVCAVEAISLVLYIIFNRNTIEFMNTVASVSFCVSTCGIIAFLSQIIIRKYKREGVISNVQTNVLIAFFYVLMSVWSILVDSAHYGSGNQMLTFFIVQFCFVNFVVMPLQIGCVLITLTFTAFYLAIYVQDGGAHMQIQNYYIFAIIAVFSNIIQNMLLYKSEKSKIEIHELNLLLQKEMRIDELTKLKNRKGLRDDFEMYSGKIVSVMMVDIDHFKHYNDTYGHVIGDEVLRLIALTIVESFPEGGAYRFGGDEILVILPNCTEAEFEDRRQKWKEAIEAIKIPNVPCSISCSYGYERCKLQSIEDLRKAIKIADDRLYQAKNSR